MLEELIGHESKTAISFCEKRKTMRKIKLASAGVLVWLLVFTLCPGGGNLWAKSKSSAFEMTSQVLCGTGGKSQSATFTIKVSTGAQPSPIGKQSSTNFDAFGGWVYTSGPSFVRGDANGDGVVDVSDISFLINYLFLGTSPPEPLGAGDATGDGMVDIADVLFLINYLFLGGSPPSCSGKGSWPFQGSAKLNPHLAKAQMGLSIRDLHEGRLGEHEDEMEIVLWGKSEQDIAGIQLEVEYDPQEVTLLEPKLTSRTQGLSIFSGGEEGLRKIGIVDLTGKNVVPAGEGELVTLKAKGIHLGSVQINKAILVDRETRKLLVEILPTVKVKTGNPEAEVPDRFSLSQNYPNPFNPHTSIEYALSKDTQVRLCVYNVLGEKVTVLVDEYQAAGHQRVRWDGRNQQGEDVASGVYFYRLETREFSMVRKMTLIR
jgi:hypothetical protein